MATEYIAIAALGKNNEIGFENELPWRLPPHSRDQRFSKVFRSADMNHFKEITANYPVLMGRKTYESIPVQYRPLKGRENIVLSSKKDIFLDEKILLYNDLSDVLSDFKDDEKVFIIGGATIYKQMYDLTSTLEITRIHQEFLADTYFPKFTDDFKKVSEDKRGFFSFERYERK